MIGWPQVFTAPSGFHSPVLVTFALGAPMLFCK